MSENPTIEEVKEFQKYAKKYFSVNGHNILMNGCYIGRALIQDEDQIILEKTKYPVFFGNVEGKDVFVRYEGTARFFFKHKIDRALSYRDCSPYETSTVACIGFSEANQSWIGFSHRCYQEFKIGHVSEKGNFECTTGWIPSYLEAHPERDYHVEPGFVCKTLEDCRKCAFAYAEAVA